MRLSAGGGAYCYLDFLDHKLSYSVLKGKVNVVIFCDGNKDIFRFDPGISG